MTALRLVAVALLVIFGAAWLVEPGFYRAVQVFAVAVAVLETAQAALRLAPRRE